MPDDTVARVLGIAPPGDFASMSLLREVEHGLPLSALDRLVKAVAPDDAGFAYRIVPRATLARRRRALAQHGDDAAARLTADESARVARLASVWAFACEVWGGEVAARRFMFREHMMLDDQRPIDVVLANEFGRPLVVGILGRLQYGSAA